MKLAALLATLVTAIVIIAGNAPAAKAETISHFQTRVQSCLYGQFSSITPIAYRASGLNYEDFWAGYPFTGPFYTSGSHERVKGGGNMLMRYGPDVYYYGWWYTTNSDGTVHYTGSLSQSFHYRLEDENRILACV